MKKKAAKLIIPLMISVFAVGLSACSSGGKSTAESTAAAVGDTAVQPAAVDAAGNQVLCDQSDIRITANGLVSDGAADPAIEITIENSSKMNITVQVKSFSVNGYMQECFMSTAVPAGALVDSEILLVTNSLKRCGIEEIANADIALHVFDDATWNTIFDSIPVTFSVKGQENYKQNHDDQGEVLFDENQIKIVSRGLSAADGLLGPEVMLYIENNTDKSIAIQSPAALINHVAIDPMLSTEILAGKKAVCTLSFMSAQLEANNIETIDSLETKFKIIDNERNSIVDTDFIGIKLK